MTTQFRGCAARFIKPRAPTHMRPNTFTTLIFKKRLSNNNINDPPNNDPKIKTIKDQRSMMRLIFPMKALMLLFAAVFLTSKGAHVKKPSSVSFKMSHASSLI